MRTTSFHRGFSANGPKPTERPRRLGHTLLALGVFMWLYIVGHLAWPLRSTYLVLYPLNKASLFGKFSCFCPRQINSNLYNIQQCWFHSIKKVELETKCPFSFLWSQHNNQMEFDFSLFFFYSILSPHQLGNLLHSSLQSSTFNIVTTLQQIFRLSCCQGSQAPRLHMSGWSETFLDHCKLHQEPNPAAKKFLKWILDSISFESWREMWLFFGQMRLICWECQALHFVRTKRGQIKYSWTPSFIKQMQLSAFTAEKWQTLTCQA